MKNKIEVVINSDGKVKHSPGFISQAAFLIYTEEKARRKLKERVDAGSSKELLNEPSTIPTNRCERYQCALSLIDVIGQAAGKNWGVTISKVDLKYLCQFFRDGILQKSNPRARLGTVGHALFECGVRFGKILFFICKVETKNRRSYIRKSETKIIVSDACRAFMKGIQKWAKLEPSPGTQISSFAPFLSTADHIATELGYNKP